MKIVALEEHDWDEEVATHFKERGPEMRNPAMHERLRDLGALRLKEMDEAGIDLQVLSHGAPATQRIDAETAVPLARRANDRLFESIQKYKSRFEGFKSEEHTSELQSRLHLVCRLLLEKKK